MLTTSVDVAGFGKRLLDLLRLELGTTVQIELLRDGSVRVVKLEEGAQK